MENVSDAASKSECSTKRNSNDGDEEDAAHADNETFNVKNDYVQDIYLTVPDTDLKRDRAASVDSSFSKMTSNGKTEELQSECDGFALTVPSNALRSRSVDIVLPTNEQERYKALALAGPSMSKRYVTCSLFLPFFLFISKKHTPINKYVAAQSHRTAEKICKLCQAQGPGIRWFTSHLTAQLP